MWCIYLLFAIFLLIYAVFIIIAYGIKLTARIDTNNLSVCVKVYIFDWIEVLCFKIFVCEQRFYYQINKNKIKTLELKKEEDAKKKKRKDKKTNVFSFSYYIFDNLPKIKIINPLIEYGAEFEDVKNRALFDGGVSVAVNSVIGAMYDKLEPVNFSIRNICDESSFRGVYFEGIIKFSLIKIFLYYLHIISVKKRFQKA